MKHVLKGGGRGGGQQQRATWKERERNQGEQEEINYLSLCGLYGSCRCCWWCLHFFFKLDLGLEKCLLFSSGLYLHKH